MKSIAYKLILSCLIAVPAITSSQETIDAPPAEVVKAAQAAFPEYDGGATFDFIMKGGGTLPSPIVIATTVDHLPHASMPPSPTPISYPAPYVATLVAESDFVGIGLPVKRWSYPTAGKCFAVSIYLVHLTRVTIPGKEGLAAGSDVYIVRPGGDFQYESHKFRAIDTDFQLFHLNEPYLFFAAEVTPGLFKVDPENVLKVQDQTLQEASNRHFRAAFYARRTTDSLLREVFTAWEIRANYRGQK